MRILSVLFCFFICFSHAQDCSDIPHLNAQIVSLTKGKLKKKVDRGECWDLAKYVLDEVGASWDGFEKYGRLINKDKECVFPGDIIQFERIKIEWSEDNMRFKESMFHHTAIVTKVIDKNELIIAHQNTAEHGRKVGESTFRFDTVKSGKLMIYRPVKP